MVWWRVCVCALACASAFPSQQFEPDVMSMLETGAMTEAPQGFGALNVSQLTINAGSTRESAIRIGDEDAAFTVRMKADGQFNIDHRSLPVVEITPDGNVAVEGKIVAAGDVQIGSDAGGSFTFKNIPQWLLHIDDSSFDDGGWSNATVSTCGGSPIPILGGYGHFSGGSTSRTYRQLPSHQEIRVKANWHFIDSWSSEFGFAKIDHATVWTDTHESFGQNTNGINLCGAPTTEGKFAVPIDLALPHTSNSMVLSFGAKMNRNPLEASWGISGLQIYVR